MHSALVRGQTVFGFFTTVAFCVAAFAAISVVFFPQAPSTSIKLRNVQVVKGRPHYYSRKKEEYAHVKFDADIDLASLFNWNTKQVFIYITATYPSSRNNEPPSQAIVWDAIIPAANAPSHHNQYHAPVGLPPPKKLKARNAPKLHTGKTGELHLKNQKPKYQITDHTGKIAERGNATLELRWNVQPYVGVLTWTNWNDFGRWKGLKGGRSKSFEFPALKVTSKEKLDTMKGGEGNRGKPA
ncbi:signal peptidase 22 kDa subunit [Patellaria atrata CBS 101060]|uniref:Signal peptidase subunit 3 n=1 Tax=Patellaria atrata CBS 101060 TaxID=1346257 RepID=A0A9P4SEG1_9PEZI|nr:signal peptidase 22 kDa subunit [Patellaria atrata CBS 101060]